MSTLGLRLWAISLVRITLECGITSTYRKQLLCSNKYTVTFSVHGTHRVSIRLAYIAVHLEAWHRSTPCGGAGQNKGLVKEISLEFLEQKISQAVKVSPPRHTGGAVHPHCVCKCWHEVSDWKALQGTYARNTMPPAHTCTYVCMLRTLLPVHTHKCCK